MSRFLLRSYLPPKQPFMYSVTLNDRFAPKGSHDA